MNTQQIIIIEELIPVDKKRKTSFLYDKTEIEKKYLPDFFINDRQFKLDNGKLFLLLVCTPKNKNPSEYKDITEVLPPYLLD